MLKPAPRYESLAVATNAEAMRPILEKLLSSALERSIEVSDVSVLRVHIGRDRRILVQYRLQYKGDAGQAPGMLFGHLLRRRAFATENTGDPRLLVVPKMRLVIPLFPFDPKLKHLEHLASGQLLPSALVAPAEPDTENGEGCPGRQIEVLGYRPMRRAVLRVAGPRGSAIVKVTRPGGAQKLYKDLRRMASQDFSRGAADGITVPAPISYSAKGVFWMEDVPDPSLFDMIGSDGFASGCLAAADALAKLHRTKLPRIKRHSVKDELRLLRSVVKRTSAVYPEVGDELRQAYSECASGAPSFRRWRAVVVHRDYYDRQVLIGPKRTTLLDLDTLQRSDPALDVGNFMAHLSFRARQMPELASEFASSRDAFLGRYRESMPSASMVNAPWWEQASLLRLVCVYLLRPQWQDVALSLLASLGADYGPRAATSSKTETLPS